MIDPADVQEFLAQRRLAVVGASDKKDSFGRTILHELDRRGYEVVAVNTDRHSVEGRAGYADLDSVPGELDGVIVMVHRDRALEVVRACAARGVPRVWLFKGLGAAGAVSDEAAQLCREHDIAVVAGACPLMFLEPVGWFHRVHRGFRHLDGSLAREPAPA
jgi:predicted CoA-binding protein